MSYNQGNPYYNPPSTIQQGTNILSDIWHSIDNAAGQLADDIASGFGQTSGAAAGSAQGMVQGAVQGAIQGTTEALATALKPVIIMGGAALILYLIFEKEMK